ncbi:DUF6880 family protein [Lichenifustis flavocetrariae]|uniref:Uncharacterized protein n=1 Tax=Lichenifustis flavocetrariae TaxID=2949735 RepID=A0AA41YZQ1_9HYPH|nr:DUF6880 family protein [Lichenifustis flavocetrariae]MCW6507868.1 hypothetical protein [Lichenifustis flavocetrariae]
MARAPSLSIESLTALGAEKLARLVLDGADRDAAFKRIVAAALAGAKGPKAVAALVDKRLAGLERARGFVEWDKVKAFAADLDATVTTIIGELGAADPVLATVSLLRFLATADGVFERADDSQGRVQAVYEMAVEGLGQLAARMPPADRAALPDRIATALGQDHNDYLPRLIGQVGPHLDEATLIAWDTRLAKVAKTAPKPKGREAEWEVTRRTQQQLAARQMIAFVRRDLDAFAALEADKHRNLQDGFGLAKLFLDAGRPKDALIWIRKGRGTAIKYQSRADLADGEVPRAFDAVPCAALEADILDALNEKSAAQALRWSTFAATLNADILRAFIGGLGEFEEFDALDRAFAHAGSAKAIHQALAFFIAWPQLERAAALVIKHHKAWNGASYEFLAPAAEALEGSHPVAAAILYRTLLVAILTQGRSNAYGIGARYLAKLDDLGAEFEAAALPDVASHVTFRAEIVKKHARKAGFWAHVKKGM